MVKYRYSLPLIVLGILLGSAATLGIIAWRMILPVNQLASAQARWARRPFSKYQLIVERDLGLKCQYDAQVQDERVVKQTITDSENGKFPQACDGFTPTVTSLFQMVRVNTETPQCGPNGCQCDGRIRVQVTYDAQLGYPVHVKTSLPTGVRWFDPFYWKSLSRRGECTAIGYRGPTITVRSLIPMP